MPTTPQSKKRRPLHFHNVPERQIARPIWMLPIFHKIPERN